MGADIDVNGVSLSALPTRDAVLPVLAVFAMTRTTAISDLVKMLPEIYTASDRIKNFARDNSLAILERGIANPKALLVSLGMGELDVVNVNTTDGLRMTLNNGEVVHFRPSGNAPELRCYAEAHSFQRAVWLVKMMLVIK